jgi:hypothetical protein
MKSEEVLAEPINQHSESCELLHEAVFTLLLENETY